MFHRFFGLAGLLLTLVAGPVLAASDTAPPPIRTFDLPTIERLGTAIYRQDRAAWLATDALVEKVPDLAGAGVKGWIVVEGADGERVRFLRDIGKGLEVGYDIVIDAKGAGPVVEPADRALTDEERVSFTARQTAVANLPGVCRAGYNTAMVKDPDGDGWLVWLLAPSPATNAVPVGGHFRFTISQDGRKVERIDALSASCLVVERKPRTKDGMAVAMFATHIVSPQPVETHVFLSLLYRTPIVVGTSDKKLWMVADGKVTPMKTDGK